MRIFRNILLTFTLLISFLLFLNINIKDNHNIKKTIKVEIRGEVKQEKIIELNLGSNFSDLLNLIELTNDADISSISLNTVLYNDQIIVIPKKKVGNLISINSASLSELVSLPGIGEKMAIRIIEYREINGSFNSLEEIMNVSGIGKSKYEKIRDFITL